MINSHKLDEWQAACQIDKPTGNCDTQLEYFRSYTKLGEFARTALPEAIAEIRGLRDELLETQETLSRLNHKYLQMMESEQELRRGFASAERIAR